MGLNDTPKGERIHIAFFGCRNAGKSSLVNAVTGQDLAIVSDVLGTTTDPVYKAMELLPLGPVMIIDTPGIDDEGELGSLRVKKTIQVLNKADIAIIVTDATSPLRKEDIILIDQAAERSIPCITVRNKADLLPSFPEDSDDTVWVSALTGKGITGLKEKIGSLLDHNADNRRIVSDILVPGDVALLVVPIDKAAPKGRLILPQQQTIRDILEAGASALVCRDTELEQTLTKLSAPPRIVITDSQVFPFVNKIVPKEIPLTSFSILMAKYKGDLPLAVAGASQVDKLNAGDSILIAEGCTHHRQCQDIGTVKIPGWLKNYTGKEFDLHFTSGTEFPDDLSKFKLVIHCGGCMLTEREMRYRIRSCQSAGVPVTNYGILIAYLNGILSRSVAPFPAIAALIK